MSLGLVFHGKVHQTPRFFDSKFDSMFKSVNQSITVETGSRESELRFANINLDQSKQSLILKQA
jgi:hypothetical protein